jgi:hypothetical protein
MPGMTNSMPHSNASRQPSRDAGLHQDRSQAPRLTIIIVSLGTRQELERAVRLLAPTAQSLDADVIVVRRNAEATLDFALSEIVSVEVVRAADDSSRADMLVLAMRAAKGDIVAVRDDTSVKDAKWLAAYHRPVESPRGPVQPPSADGPSSASAL